ncbi:MAG: NAD-dependent epimerase/dehydratase family protein [Gemmataceae bacterium]
MKVLVTGGGGFIGRAIVERLLERGDSVRSFSRGCYASLAARGVEVHQGDLADGDAVVAAAEGCELIFHVAARAGIWGRYADYYLTNVVGTENVLNACRRWGISRLVYTSSPSVVFNGSDMEGVNEATPYPERYEAAYPETKALAEKLVLTANCATLATVALRPHLVWGPGDTNLIPRILERGKNGQLRCVGRTPKLVDSTYIDNGADAHLLAADRLLPGSPICGKAYFIGQNEPMPLWELINRILEAGALPPVTKTISPGLAYLTGWIMELFYGGLRIKAEPPMTRFLARELSTTHWFDLSAARRDLDYEPKIDIAEGLRRLKSRLSAEPARPQTHGGALVDSN